MGVIDILLNYISTKIVRPVVKLHVAYVFASNIIWSACWWGCSYANKMICKCGLFYVKRCTHWQRVAFLRDHTISFFTWRASEKRNGLLFHQFSLTYVVRVKQISNMAPPVPQHNKTSHDHIDSLRPVLRKRLSTRSQPFQSPRNQSSRSRFFISRSSRRRS